MRSNNNKGGHKNKQNNQGQVQLKQMEFVNQKLSGDLVGKGEVYMHF